MSDSLIIDRISFWYKNRKPLFSEFSAQLSSGDLLLIQGKNGSGKSTFLKLLASLFIPRQGTITLNGIDISKQPRSVRPWIGFSNGPQQGFYLTLTGFENLRFFSGMKGTPSQDLKTEILELADRFRLPNASLDLRYREYSSGMRQKLGLIRAFLGAPKLLILDEPFSFLDDASEESVANYISELRLGKKAIFVIASPKRELETTLKAPPECRLLLEGQQP